jgi:glycosyltransferase involved in cell wall biosynthesis
MFSKDKHYPKALLHDPNPDLSLEEIYELMDNWTWEGTPSEWGQMAQRHQYFQLTEIILPPLQFEGRFIKGILLTQFCDFMLTYYPQLKELFHIVSSSGYVGHSWSEEADAIVSFYENPTRADWFKKRYPDRQHMALVTTGEEDWTNEQIFTPRPHLEKNYDLITINRIFVDFKNPDFFAAVLKTYEKKYDYRLKVLMPVDLDDLKRENTHNWAIKDRYNAFCQNFDNIKEYIHFVPLVNQREMANYYTQSKMYVLTSLLEGKNRSLYEAQSCDIPVICAEEFNQFARGGAPAFAEGSGQYAKYDPECFADAIHEMRNSYGDFRPRKSFLSSFSGRKWCLNQSIDNFEYYKTHLPDYQAGNHYENPWLEMAMHYNYQIGLHQFIFGDGINYGRYTSEWNWHMGTLLKFYLIRFGFNLL